MHEGHHDILGQKQGNDHGHAHDHGHEHGHSQPGRKKRTNTAQIVSIVIVAVLVISFVVWKFF